jgi:hypothetical protein
MQLHSTEVAAITLAVGLAGASFAAHAQTGPAVDWVAVLSAETDSRLEVTNCGSDVCVRLLGSPPPNSGIAALDLVTFGDIVGDAGTEAVVPIDSGGSIGVIGSLIYLIDDSGTPQLVLTDGPGGNVFIDPSANDLVSVTFDQSCSSRICSSYVRTGYRLVAGVLQQQGTCTFLRNTVDQAHPQGSCTPGATTAATPTLPVAASSPASATLRIAGSSDGKLYAILSSRVWSLAPGSITRDMIPKYEHGSGPVNGDQLPDVILNSKFSMFVERGEDGKIYISEAGVLWELNPGTITATDLNSLTPSGNIVNGQVDDAIRGQRTIGRTNTP